MSNPLPDLLAVQAFDTTLDQLRHRRAHLPERAELAAIGVAEAELSAERATTGAALDDVAGRQSEVEAELATAEERMALLNKRMYGGEVSASKDLQAMSEEIEHLGSRVSGLEDAVLELLEEREPIEARLGELSAAAAQLEVQRGEVEARRAEAEAAIDAELASVGGERRAAAEPLPETLVATYDRLRARLGGVGVARLVGNHCDGCHLTLPSAELDRVRHLPEGELYFCEQCSRILVP